MSILCVCGGGVIILLAGYLPDVHSVCGGGGGGVILLAGYLPDVHCVGMGRGEGVKGGAGDIILLFTYLSVQVLMSLLCGGSTSSSFCLLTHLAHLDKREPTTHLLTERTLILALTLLVNVEQNNVPGVCEVPILQCMQRIRASKVCQCVSLCAVSVFGVSISVGCFLQSLGVSIYLCFFGVFSSVIGCQYICLFAVIWCE